MFNIFNVSEKKEKDNISVEINEGDILEENVWQVALDIIENEDFILIVAPLAWVDIENVDISISKNILTISWERIKPTFYDEEAKILVKECFFGPYSRSVILPENLAFNKIHATMENNLLLVEIPKLKFDSKTIKIDKLEWLNQ